MSGPLERDTAFGAKQETESEHDGEPDQPHEHLGGMAGGSLADLNYGGVPGSSARLITAPHVHVIQPRSRTA